MSRHRWFCDEFLWRQMILPGCPFQDHSFEDKSELLFCFRACQVGISGFPQLLITLARLKSRRFYIFLLLVHIASVGEVAECLFLVHGAAC